MSLSYIDWSSMPVGLLNDRKPLGHSGQRRLHEVVGSMASDMGKPLMVACLLSRE
jgi:hypothetical protein